MLIGEMEASFLGFLMRIHNVMRVLEVGTFTGYSALAMAENLPVGGEIHTIDIEQKDYTKKYWQKSPHGSKIYFHKGKGLKVIPEIPGTFDMAFIDADKENYLNYFNLILPKLTPKGFVVVDNVLWSGKVLQPAAVLERNDHATPAIQKFNDYISTQPHLYSCLLPIRDGVLLITRKR